LLALDALIDRAVSAFDYDLSILSLPDGERRMANLRKLMRLAAEYERHEGRDLRGFLDFAEDRTRRDEREGMAAMQVEGGDGVRVMTVHAAKGLEFGVVAVADLGRTLGAGFRHPDVVIGRLSGDPGDPAEARFGMRLPSAAGDSLRLWELVQLCEEERQAEVEESLRLLYVAASRARERLILSGIVRRPKPTESVEASSSSTVVDLLLGALWERGWSGDDSEVELEPAPAVGGGAADGPAPKLAVRVQRPSAERAAALRRRWPAAGSRPAPPSPPSRPLLARPMRPAPTGHLSYSALADYAGCGYRFYVERVLGLAAPLAAGDGEPSDPAELEPELDEQVDPALGPRRRSLAIGNCVHGALESSARNRWARPPDDEIDAILAREGIADDAEARDRVETLLDNWLGSQLRRELHERGARTRPEVPFVLGLGGAIVRGKIDLLAETDAGATVVDYKTDALRGVDPTELADRYRTQRDLYAVAIGRARATRSDGPIRAAYCFLEAPERTVIEEYDQAAIESASERLELLVAGIRAGEFPRTENPHASLCYGCPAAARLCAKPAWRPQWAAAATG
jgi:ATP-dependent exoDNAse (exonuclease V) beta subunit